MGFDLCIHICFVDSLRGQKNNSVIVADVQDIDLEESLNFYNKKQIILTPIKHEEVERTLGGESSRYMYSNGFDFVSSGTTAMAMVPPMMSSSFDTKPRKMREQAKVSPYMANIPKQEHLFPPSVVRGHDRGRSNRSPKLDVRLPPLEVEVNNAALQGKLAYVSPTMRTGYSSQKLAATQNMMSHAGTVLASKHRSGNINFGSRHTGGTSQLSPLQGGVSLAQPVFLSAGTQMEFNRYAVCEIKK